MTRISSGLTHGHVVTLEDAGNDKTQRTKLASVKMSWPRPHKIHCELSFGRQI